MSFLRNSSLLKIQIDIQLLEKKGKIPFFFLTSEKIWLSKIVDEESTDFLLLIIAHHHFSFCFIIQLLPLLNTNDYR